MFDHKMYIGIPPCGIAEKTCIANHRKVLILNVTDKTSDKGEDLQGHEGDLSSFCIISVGKANDLAVTPPWRGSILGHDSPFRITADIFYTEAWIKKRGADVYLMNWDIFQYGGIKTQYSIIPLFHYSNCERSELTCPLSDLEILRNGARNFSKYSHRPNMFFHPAIIISI